MSKKLLFVLLFSHFINTYAQLGPQDETVEVTTSRLDKNDQDSYIIRENGYHKFTIIADKKGYIYVVGDYHHYGSTGDNFALLYPERYRASRNYNNVSNREDLDNFNLYWISENPEGITNFKYIRGDAKRAIPAYGFTYPSFHADMNGDIYIKHRSKVEPRGHYI